MLAARRTPLALTGRPGLALDVLQLSPQRSAGTRWLNQMSREMLEGARLS